MSTLDASPSNNGRGSEAWSESWTHFRVERRSPGYCRVTFDHPPVNAITATTVAELGELVGLIEEDDDLNVIVFHSANPDFDLTHSEAERNQWLDLLVRMSRVPVISIAAIRGRARGAGSEFVLACDLVASNRLEEEVELIASCLAGLDHDAIGRTKARLLRVEARPGG
jgi:enoyl-CoA hydratase/carnithine racemase